MPRKREDKITAGRRYGKTAEAIDAAVAAGLIPATNRPDSVSEACERQEREHRAYTDRLIDRVNKRLAEQFAQKGLR